jgi:hypothetical protein
MSGKKMRAYVVQLWCALKLCATSENNAKKWNMQFTSIYKMYIHNLNCKISKTEFWTMKNDAFASKGKIDFSSPIWHRYKVKLTERPDKESKVGLEAK